MSCFLSHSLETSCGDSRGVSGLFNLLQCTDSVESHLSLIHLSKESVTEGELILARAGLFDIDDSVVAKMLVCAKHRHTYGKFWRQRSACQYPTHPGSDSKGAKSRYSVNLEMSKAISKMYGVLVQVGSVICINCCNKHNASVKEMPWVSLEPTEKEDSDSCAYVRPSKDAALQKFKLAMSSPITPSSSKLSHSTNDEMWTPSAVLALDESIEIQDFRPTRGNVQDPIQVFNACIDSLADALQKPRITHLESQVDCWEKCSFTEKSEFVQKAGEACQLVCDVIAPRDGKALFQAVVDHEQKCKTAIDVGLQTLMVAYQNAPTKSLKTQILNIYADRFSANELKRLHQPFENLSDRQIKKARAQAKSEGPGVPIEKIPRHRIRIQQRQLDHFLEFTMRPYYYQDVAYGTRTIKLENGEEFVIPNVVRTVAKCTIINQYTDHCKQTGFQPISKSTMWRVLEVQGATQRKSLRGLDNTAAEGADGFKDFLQIIDELERVRVEKDWCKEVRKRLQESKLYLKTTYRNHCKEDNSKCADHCRVFALSDAGDTDFQKVCSHSHNVNCEDCEKLKSVLEEVSGVISEYTMQLGKVQAEDHLYEAKNAAAKIFGWKGHILREEKQNQCKRQILDSLKGDEAFIVVDWAMKFTAMKFGEKQAEWFAKRGINWHVSSVVVRQEESLEVTCYVHLFNSCKQDWFSVLSVLENLFVTIKLQNPGIRKAFLRSDEAGCYHNSKLVSSLRELGHHQGIELVRYDHSEPQAGKDMCDRILCPLKASIRGYCNEGHDVVSAKDMYNALKERSVKGTTASVCIVQEQNSTLEINKIANFNSLHNFEFTHEGLRVWRAFNVGPGKFIPSNKIVICPQKKTDLVEEIPFFPTTARRIASAGESNDGNDGSTYQCPEPGCDEDFKTQADLDLHMNLLVHHVSPVPASMTESLYDKVKREWVHHFQSMSLGNEISTELVAMATEPLTNASQLPMGWALHKRSASVRFSQNVRQYLTQKFNIGRDTGRKQDPEQVAKDMRTACTIDGERMFDRAEWLSGIQIQGFFSRLCLKERSKIQQESDDATDVDDEDDDLVEASASDVDEECLREARNTIMDEIGLKHPIMFDIYDVCSLAREGRLPSLKVKILRDMCKHFHLSFKMRDTKAALLAKMEEMISECSCYAI